MMRRPLLGLTAFLLVGALTVRRVFALVTVTGDSMAPALAPGDRVLVCRAPIGRLRRGQLAVVEVPGADGYQGPPPRGRVDRREWMIKRVAAVPGDTRPDNILPATAGPPGGLVPPGKFVVLGDNAVWSHDSRHIGYIPGDRLLGVAIRRVSPDRGFSDVVNRSACADSVLHDEGWSLSQRSAIGTAGANCATAALSFSRSRSQNVS
jgi:signal peptidase I